LIVELGRLAPEATVVLDLPSRLAERLARGQLDVALIPTIEYFRGSDYQIVSDACIACEGPVRSVKLFSRAPIDRIRTLSLDEGSRTSAALVRILLLERFNLEPDYRPLPIGRTIEECETDAVLLIGDRAMRPVSHCYHAVWDLGDEWNRWTGLPFVFATWVARSTADLPALDVTLTAARNAGVKLFKDIARTEAPKVGLPEKSCLEYLRDNLTFRLGEREREGLARFQELARQAGLVPGE
jgi:chorismate dehydratase